MTNTFSKRICVVGILLALTCSPLLLADSGGIGFAVVDGSLLLNRTRVWGNATIFNGTAVETVAASSLLHLNGGSQIRLAADSRATVYERNLVLEKGYGQLEANGNYAIEARSLTISAAGPKTLASVKIDGGSHVTVAALLGKVSVANSAGVLVAKLESGDVVGFDSIPDGATAPTRATGCLLEKSGGYVLLDQTTNVLLEVQGTGLRAGLGNRVKIAGIAKKTQPSVEGASQVVYVTDLQLQSKGGCRAITSKLGAAGTAASARGTAGSGTTVSTAGASASSGVSTATVAVIGGVAAAATVGSLAAVGAFPGQAESAPTASR